MPYSTKASQLLANARTLDDVKQVRDVAEAAGVFARAAKLGLDLQNRAAEVKLRAERRAGVFLAELHLRGGDRKSKLPRVTLKLDDLGISRQQSMRWQELAAVSEEAFNQFVETTISHRKELTATALLRLARMHKPSQDSDGTVVPMIIYPPKSESESLVQLVSELQNHRDLLNDVLRPIYQGSDYLLKPAERRVVGHLLREMDATLKGLAKQVRHLP